MAHGPMLSPSHKCNRAQFEMFADAIPLRKVIRSNFLK